MLKLSNLLLLLLVIASMFAFAQDSSLNDGLLVKNPDRKGYAECVAKCPNCGGCGYARQSCIEGCVDEYFGNKKFSTLLKKLN
jgi:hypothetical protein